MDRMNVEFEYQVRRSLGSWLLLPEPPAGAGGATAADIDAAGVAAAADAGTLKVSRLPRSVAAGDPAEGCARNQSGAGRIVVVEQPADHLAAGI